MADPLRERVVMKTEQEEAARMATPKVISDDSLTASAATGDPRADYETVTSGRGEVYYVTPRWSEIERVPEGRWFVMSQWSPMSERPYCDNFIYEKTGHGHRMVVRAPWLGPEAAEDLRKFADEHNAYSSLIAQRDALREALAKVVRLVRADYGGHILADALDAADTLVEVK